MTRKKVLLIDDNNALLSILERSLKQDFDIVAFNQPLEALQYISENSKEVNIVVTDYKMPEKDGLEVLRKVREINPSISRILFTGYFDDVNSRPDKEVCNIILEKSILKKMTDFIVILNDIK